MLTKRILLIDDDDDDRLLFCEALVDIAPQFSCDTAVSGNAALNVLHNREIALPDLILLDVNMPGLNGWECLTVLKSQDVFKDIPVIMYSTSYSPDDIRKAIRFGAVCFYTKPGDYNEFKKSLTQVVDHLSDGTLHMLAYSSPSFTGAPIL